MWSTSTSRTVPFSIPFSSTCFFRPFTAIVFCRVDALSEADPEAVQVDHDVHGLDGGAERLREQDDRLTGSLLGGDRLHPPLAAPFVAERLVAADVPGGQAFDRHPPDGADDDVLGVPVAAFRDRHRGRGRGAAGRRIGMGALDGAHRDAAYERARGPVAGTLLHLEEGRRPVVVTGDQPRPRGCRAAGGTGRADARFRRVAPALDATVHEAAA